MPSRPEWTPRDWFEAAARIYVDGHQACAWCSATHQVYKGQRGSRLEYYCPACDFYSFHDHTTDQYFAAPGQDPVNLFRSASLTMAAR